MTTNSRTSYPPLGAGLSSVVLGSVGLLLFFLPVLGIPLAIAGLALGSAGFLVGFAGRWSSLRWSVAGLVVSGMALGIGILIALTPIYYSQDVTPPASRQMVPDYCPYVPPPARPEN